MDGKKTRFRSIVNSAEEATPRLPLVHTTDVYKFVDALDSGSVEPRPCEVFNGESLVYMFYGRPSFRSNDGAEPTTMAHYLPVCLLFSLEKCGDIRRIFPFDSGAFDRGMYEAFLHANMKLDDFGLVPDVKTPGKLISKFFGSVTDYMNGRAVSGLNADATQFEAHSYLELVSAKGANSIDSRSSSIEVQLSNSVNISEAVMAIILPSTFLDGEVGGRLKSLGIDMLPYKIIDRMRPSEYVSKMFELCDSYYTARDLI